MRYLGLVIFFGMLANVLAHNETVVWRDFQNFVSLRSHIQTWRSSRRG